MKKNDLERFITKYNLSGAVESIKLIADKNGISTTFASDDKAVIGTISTSLISLDNGEYSIYETDILKKLITVLGDDISVKVQVNNGKAVALNLSDSTSKVTFVLADPINIKKVPSPKRTPNFELSIPLNKDFTERYVKAAGALSDISTFTVISDGKSTDIVLGYSTMNTTRVTLPVSPTKLEKIDPIDFHAKYFKELLIANKESSGAILEISTEGLARVTFDISDFKAQYNLLKIVRDE